MKTTLKDALKELSISKVLNKKIRLNNDNTVSFIIEDKGGSKINPLKRKMEFKFNLDSEIEFKIEQ